MASDEPPLIAGRIHGIRRWSVGWTAGDAVLCGFGNARWASGGEPTRARCRAHGRLPRTHRAPKGNCSCGLYAVHPWESRSSLYGGAGVGHWEEIHGIVEAWGRIELHAQGFRAEYARPVALALVGVPRRSDAGRVATLLARRYRAELIEVADVRDLGEHCRERGWGLSREVVRSLVPDEAPRAPVPRATATAPVPPSPPRPPTRRERAVEVALTAVGVILGIAWYGFWAYVAVMVAIGIISGDFGSDSERFGSEKLRVTDEALVRRGGELRYVAIVRNTSEKRVAVSVFARGKVVDHDGDRVARLGRRRHVDGRPTLLPGETGVVVDVLPRSQNRPVPDRVRFRTELRARREPAPEIAPPVRLGSPSLDRARCSLRVPVRARDSVRGAGITIVATDAAGEVSAAGTIRLGAGAIERGRRELVLGDPGPCPGWLQSVRVYPFLLPATLARSERQHG